MGFNAVAMEDYVARDDRPIDRCLAEVGRCDIFVLVLAYRYGFIPQHGNPQGLSITELEYRHARQLGKPCFIFLLAPDVAWPISQMDTDTGLEAIKRFRNQLPRELLVTFFSSVDDLSVQIAAAIQNWSSESFAKERVKQERETTAKKPPKPPPRIFLSYSHTDARWLSRLQIHLRVIERRGIVDLWSDTRIHAGAKWREELRDAIKTSSAAVLLLSADFLASEFIMTNELPPLLAAGERRGVLIIPIMISACRFQSIKELAQFQCINDPSKPLNLMPKGRQEQVFDNVAERIMSVFEKWRGKP
jgi:hypothetical protein